MKPGRARAAPRISPPESARNFSRVALPSPPDFGVIADLILRALYEGYDARAESTLEFTAPFAPGLTLACDPIG